MLGDRSNRLDGMIASVLPLGICFIFVFLNVAPWPFPWLHTVISSLPLMVLCFWIVHQPEQCPPMWSFMLGLVQDILIGQPIGLSAFSFLCVDYFLRYQRFFANPPYFRQLWLLFAVIIFAVQLLQIAVIMAMSTQIPNLISPILMICAAIFIFPFMTLLLHGVQRLFLSGL